MDDQFSCKKGTFTWDFTCKKGTSFWDGNSLGLLSVKAEQSLLQVLDTWKTYGIDGWTEGEHPWFYLAETLGEKLAPLIGAAPEETIVTGSTTVNLHQLVASFYEPQVDRTKILSDRLAFPTDIYALHSQLQLRGYSPQDHLVKVKSTDGHTLAENDIIEAMTGDIALIVLPSVLYRSGQILDMKKLTEEAHRRNILIGFDLCHSVGSVPHRLSEWDVDFAFWCTYKHLNAGPGAVGGLYVNKRHSAKLPGLAGWFGSCKDKQFDMAHEFTPQSSAGAFQLGTPHILSMAPLIGSLEMFHEAGMEHIRSKSLRLTGYMLDLITHELVEHGFVIRNPLQEERRGGHVFLEHPEAARICKALKASGIIPDFRAPNGIRLAPVALYNSFRDVWVTIQKLKTIMKEQHYKNFKNERGVVS
jgi:kynureninase